jgi:exopolysaccharide biosynthesis protein
MQLAAGVKYAHYDCDLVPRKVHILEINLADPSVEVTTSYANDCIPNPNGNKNSNNGFKVRETLSQLCNRKRSEGQNIIAGINTGFFDSNDGISRGFHIEEGEPVYINNPAVVSGLPNHSWGLTVFTDGTASCGKKGFSGRIKVSDKEFNWLSMNDTIMRNTSEKYQINLYDYHYKQYPHPSNKSLTNKLAKNALYVIAEYEGESMKVNGGYAKAKVVSISDGRASALASLPYITSKKQVGISLSGDKANEFGSLVQVGTEIEFRCDMTIEGETTRPIYTQNSTMYHIFKDGKDNMSSVGSTSSLHTTHDPMTFPVVSKDKKTLWLIEVDGRQGWYSTGLTGHEIVGFAKKLGGYKSNMNAYIMASLSMLSDGNLDLMYIWENQLAQQEVVDKIEELIPLVWVHLTASVGSGNQSSNINEWSKKPECWNRLKLKLSEMEKFDDTLMQTETNEDGSYLNETQQARIKEAEDVPAAYWFELSKWAKTNDALTPMDRKAAFNFGAMRSRNQKFKSLKQALYALKIIATAKELGFEG